MTSKINSATKDTKKTQRRHKGREKENERRQERAKTETTEGRYERRQTQTSQQKRRCALEGYGLLELRAAEGGVDDLLADATDGGTQGAFDG